MGVIPEVIIKPTETKIITQPGMAGTIAVIGAFDSEESNLQAFKGLREAQEKLGVDKDLMGCKILDKLFQKGRGASSILAANITTINGETKETELTTAKLTAALDKLKGEKYDMLFIAAELEDAAVTMVKTFIDEEYDLQKPVGTILALKRNTVEAAETTVAQFKTGGLYGAITQEFTLLNGIQLSLIESAAYYCGYIAGLRVDESMTMSQLPDVINVTPEYNFSETEDGNKLVAAGVTILRCIDRISNKFVVVNSEQPCGRDLYIERTKDFIIRGLELETFLGDKNFSNTLTSIKSWIETKKQGFINTLEGLLDINYEVEKESAKCVNVYLDSLVFAGIIEKIQVYVVVEVE